VIITLSRALFGTAALIAGITMLSIFTMATTKAIRIVRPIRRPHAVLKLIVAVGGLERRLELHPAEPALQLFLRRGSPVHDTLRHTALIICADG
jgi:hypothetical protein